MTYLLNYCRFCDFYPFQGQLLVILRHFVLFEAKQRKFHHHRMLEMYYKMFVPISFQVWTIFRLQFGKFAELMPILRFWPFSGTLSWPFCVLLHTLKLNKGNLTTIECLKCIIECLYQLVYKFYQFLDSKLTYLLNYCRFCDFYPFWGQFLVILRHFAHFEAK